MQSKPSLKWLDKWWTLTMIHDAAKTMGNKCFKFFHMVIHWPCFIRPACKDCKHDGRSLYRQAGHRRFWVRRCIGSSSRMSLDSSLLTRHAGKCHLLKGRQPSVGGLLPGTSEVFEWESMSKKLPPDVAAGDWTAAMADWRCMHLNWSRQV